MRPLPRWRHASCPPVPGHADQREKWGTKVQSASTGRWNESRESVRNFIYDLMAAHRKYSIFVCTAIQFCTECCFPHTTRAYLPAAAARQRPRAVPCTPCHLHRLQVGPAAAAARPTRGAWQCSTSAQISGRRRRQCAQRARKSGGATAKTEKRRGRRRVGGKE
jgi:hypothetical protein